ncbi:hypothetical protein HAX54_024568 [Datura stramonium]|uniref:Ubiquitin-like protease family profile domain-containing protein n=1 Tax=Datura stramonium TaxID=4076 RepID=A0ABS8V165_DATST|nr:hypothetical protein [Datura stramonium]
MGEGSNDLVIPHEGVNREKFESELWILFILCRHNISGFAVAPIDWGSLHCDAYALLRSTQHEAIARLGDLSRPNPHDGLYLQKTKPHADVDEYHFFNTYFYQKLKEAILIKHNEKEASFVRLRRWWKGVNIFEKAYIFLPIHEE